MLFEKLTYRDKENRKKTISMIFENNDLIVVNKPSGLPVIPDRWDNTLPNLRDLTDRECRKSVEGDSQLIWVVHRIDADTSGIVVFARTAEMHKELNSLFENQQIDKTYLAVIRGTPPEDIGIIELPIMQNPDRRQLMQVHKKGKPSLTHFTVLEKFKQFSLLELSPKTGRTHQIRVHLTAINCPLAIDPIYGSQEPISLSNIKRRYHRNTDVEARSLISRLTLHAYRLRFKTPLTNREQSFEAPLPKDFNALLKALRKWQ